MSPRASHSRGGPGWAARLLAAAPATSALVLSFDGLTELARASRVAERLAYLWPIALDATGVVASLIWLDRRMPADARRAARALALATIVLSVSGNGLWHWLVETSRDRPHVAIQIAVGAVPPGVLFALLHVWQLATRRPATSGQPARPPRPAGPPSPPPIVVHGDLNIIHRAGALLDIRELPAVAPRALIAPATSPTSQPDPASQPDQPDQAATSTASPPGTAGRPAGPGQPGAWRAYLDPARPLLADQPGIGRQALATALGVAPSVARKVLDHLRTEPRPAADALALPIGATP